jgi:hypothetical protein
MKKKIGKIISEQDPFNVGVTLQVVSEVIVIDANDNIENLTYLKGEWKELPSNKGKGSVWNGTEFINPQPYASWTFDNTNKIWNPPVTKPDNPSTTVTETVDGVEETHQKDTYKMWWVESNLRWEAIKISDNQNYYWNPDNSTWNLIS